MSLQRPRILGLFLAGCALALSASPTAAANAVPMETPQTLEQANAQRERAAAMKQAAEDQLAAAKNACHKKILVSGCLRDAHTRYRAAIVDARNVDIPARTFQRDAKRADVEAKEEEREAEQPAREAEQQEQAADFRNKEATHATERERKIAEKAEQAAKYREKAAAEDKARQERQAERAKRDTEIAARRAKRDADAEAETKARLAKP